jgi:hypothetical protein
MIIFQCPECLRCFTSEGFVSHPLRAFVPALQACGAADCGGVQAAWREAQRAKEAANALRLKQWRDKRARGSKGEVRDARPSCDRGGVWSPVKENEDDLRRVDAPAVADLGTCALSHAAEQARFVANGDGVSDCERMLEILFGDPDKGGFRVDDETRTSRGPWVSSHDLKYKHRIETPNSRASQLRGSGTLEAHPIVQRWRLDIDCRRNPARYSVCFCEHSERLAAENQRNLLQPLTKQGI